jgi:hypothetical protein
VFPKEPTSAGPNILLQGLDKERANENGRADLRMSLKSDLGFLIDKSAFHWILSIQRVGSYSLMKARDVGKDQG